MIVYPEDLRSHILPFRPNPAFRGGWQQTLREVFEVSRLGIEQQQERATERRPPPDFCDAKREIELVPCADESSIPITINLPRGEPLPEVPLFVLVHGFDCNQDYPYVAFSARHILDQGWPVARVNLRGTERAHSLAHWKFEWGYSFDIAPIVNALARTYERPIILIGFSHGGSLVINSLYDELSSCENLKAVVAVCPILDFRDFSEGLECNPLVRSNILRKMRNAICSNDHDLDETQRATINGLQRLSDLDDTYSRHVYGIKNCDAYYDFISPLRRIQEGRISTPLLLISAEDDPWIRPNPYSALLQDVRLLGHNIFVIRSEHGGHCGFHGEGTDVQWSNLWIKAFLQYLGIIQPLPSCE